MKVLVGCEFSGVVRQAFRNLGYDAWSCDLLPSNDDSPYHLIGDVRNFLDKGWDLGVFHPPCTYLTNAGVRHLYDHVTSKNGKRAEISGERRWEEMYKACDFFNELLNCNIPKVCVENPIPHRYARERIGYYDQIIQPWMFGHPEKKATCLWLKGLPKLIPTKNVKEEMLKLPKREQNKVHYASPGPDRWKRRSITYKGFAEAMSEQWSNL